MVPDELDAGLELPEQVWPRQVCDGHVHDGHVGEVGGDHVGQGDQLRSQDVGYLWSGIQKFRAFCLNLVSTKAGWEHSNASIL